MYEDTEARVVLNGVPGKPLELERGVRQGCPLAMLIYVVFVNPLVKSLRDRLPGVRVRGRTYKVSAYVDDLAVVLG